MRLADLMVPFMKLSNNMHAEQLTKAMSRRTGGNGSWPDGVAVTTAYLAEIGTPMSGITPDRRLRADPAEPADRARPGHLPAEGPVRGLVPGVLRLAAGRRQPQPDGRRHPPHRMNGTRAANNARAKTGTLTGVTALSGYVTGRDGRRYTYSMISNYSGHEPSAGRELLRHRPGPLERLIPTAPGVVPRNRHRLTGSAECAA